MEIQAVSQGSEGTEKPVEQTPVEQAISQAAPVAEEKAAGSSESPPEAVEKPAYQPNFKFKSFDKEYEFDESLRSLVKDEATEKHLRALYEKGHGIETIKEQRERVREELKSYRDQYDPVIQDLKKVGSFLQNKDLGSFLKAWDIKEDQVLQYAVNLANYKQMSPEQKAQIDAQEHTKQRTYDLASENEALRQQTLSHQTQNLEFQLNMTLGRPEIEQAAKAYDARVGQPGSFRQLVLQQGDYHYRATGKLVSPELVAQEVIKIAGLNQTNGTQNQGATQTPSPAHKAVEQKATIPNVQGSGNSAVKQRVKSLDDIKKRAKELSESA